MPNPDDLLVYQRSLALSIAIHNAAPRFRRGAAPTLKRQLLRAMESIVSNISEGAAAESDPLFAEFLRHAYKSAIEAKGQLQLGRGVGVLPKGEIDGYLDELDQIRRMIYAFRQAVVARCDS